MKFWKVEVNGLLVKIGILVSERAARRQRHVYISVAEYAL